MFPGNARKVKKCKLPAMVFHLIYRIGKMYGVYSFIIVT